MNKIISKVEEIRIDLRSPERLMETAVKTALMYAGGIFGIDDCGHSEFVEDWERSNCSIEIEFKSLKINTGYLGATYTIVFNAWCEKEDEEDL